MAFEDFWPKLLNTGKSALEVERSTTDPAAAQAKSLFWFLGPVLNVTPDPAQLLLASINGAEPGSVTIEVEVSVLDACTETIPWINGTVEATPYVTTENGDINPPTISGGNDIVLTNGVGSFTLVLDTAATGKNYGVGDIVGAALQKLRFDGLEIELTAVTLSVEAQGE
ncbi:MAG: hypothetical protein JW990_21315 [Thermoleophilia bacterium]|nr:hypothetical protein [Thermoleophilia bacterium]